jgi:beta-phosphoglucomutase-like phosphatase (HAD superfamily)
MADIGGLPWQQRRCAVFGDGPVEIREARKNGAVAIGLASNEEQRFGINPRKRSRLILAGADLLIPDFSWADELVAHLGWNL